MENKSFEFFAGRIVAGMRDETRKDLQSDIDELKSDPRFADIVGAPECYRARCGVLYRADCMNIMRGMPDKSNLTNSYFDSSI